MDAELVEEKKLKASSAALITQFSALTQYLNPGCKVLDLACGSGRNGQWFNDLGCHVTYLDRNLSGLDVEADDDKVELLEWDLEDGSAPTLPAEQYDIVLVL